MIEQITFSDVLIKPQYSEVLHRSEVDIGSDFEYFYLGLPVISANMRSITESAMAVAMAKDGGLGILHRFESAADINGQIGKVFDGTKTLYGSQHIAAKGAVTLQPDTRSLLA